MPTRYVLRVQADQTDDPREIEQRLLRLVKDTGAEEISVFFAHMEFFAGHETPEEVAVWLDWSRPWRTALRDAGVTVSLNPPHEIGHADWGRSARQEPWQRLVDQNGRVAEVQVCPLDPGWQAYYERLLRMFVREDFDIIWVEDDIRLHNHAPLDWGGCFCPLHLAAFRERTGVDASREELVAACTAAGEPHPWRDQWLDTWQDTLLDLVRSWRAITSEHGRRLGLMSSRMPEHAAEGRRWEDWLNAFDVHRPHFWYYSDVPGSELPCSIAGLDLQRRMQPEGLISYPEIENWPYWRWNKSYRQTAAQCALAHIMGSDGLSLSLYDFPGNRPDDDPTRARFLHAWRDTFDWLADTFPKSLRSTGVMVPWSQDVARRVRLGESSGRWQSLEVPSAGWAPWLAACGQPFAAVPVQEDAPAPGDVVSLSGPDVWAYSDSLLRTWLARGVLLDGLAAKILFDRGFGPLIGLSAAEAWDGPPATIEVCTDPEFGWLGAKVSVDFDHVQLLRATPVEGARVAGELRGPRHERLGPGLVLHENSLGGRVAVVPWNLGPVFMTPQRERQLTATLDWLGEGVRATGHPWLVTQALTDGVDWRVVIWNASPDDVEQIEVRLPEPDWCTQVDASGARFAAEYDDGVLRLARPLRQWEFVAIGRSGCFA